MILFISILIILMNRFDSFTKSINEDGSIKIKPVMTITVDGIPDENTSYQKVVEIRYIRFKFY